MTGISTAISLRFPLSLCISHLPGLTLILTHNDLPSRHQGVLRATVHSRPRWPAAVRAGAGEKVARLLPGPETVLEPEWGKLVKNSPVSSDTGDTGAQAESGSGVRSVLESREWVGHRLARHRLVPGVARSISQIYSLSVASSVKFQALKPLHWPQAARYENPFISKCIELICVSFYVIHSLFILSSDVYCRIIWVASVLVSSLVNIPLSASLVTRLQALRVTELVTRDRVLLCGPQSATLLPNFSTIVTV